MPRICGKSKQNNLVLMWDQIRVFDGDKLPIRSMKIECIAGESATMEIIYYCKAGESNMQINGVPMLKKEFPLQEIWANSTNHKDGKLIKAINKL